LSLAKEGSDTQLAMAQLHTLGVIAELGPLLSFGEVPITFLVVTLHSMADPAIVKGDEGAV
jgi:hypothetical protein